MRSGVLLARVGRGSLGPFDDPSRSAEGSQAAADGSSTQRDDPEPAAADSSVQRDVPPLRRTAGDLASAVDDLVVVCDDVDREAVATAMEGIDHRIAVDPGAGDGPVAAIRTGVRVAGGSTVAVLAGDRRVDASLLDRLWDADGDAAVPRVGDRLHPLHAVYDGDAARAACDRTLATGSGRLYDVLSRLDPVVVDVESDDDGRVLARDSRADLTPATDRLGS